MPGLFDRVPVEISQHSRSTGVQRQSACALSHWRVSLTQQWLGAKSSIELGDFLIIAPYNAQVFELQERLPGARIGTVDKFQGQEAPIVIYSMATSSHSDAPRGMEFLYSATRGEIDYVASNRLCKPDASDRPGLRTGHCDVAYWHFSDLPLSPDDVGF